MTINEAKALLEFCERKNIKCVKFEGLEAEFFKAEPAPLDTKELVKAMTDSMPPDSAMMFASTEGIDDPNDKEA